MDQYYVHDGVSQSGPFNLEQLRQKKIMGETNIWAPGMSGWTKASEITELASILSVAPPPFNSNQSPYHSQPAFVPSQPGYSYSQYESKPRKSNRPLLMTIAVLFVIVIAFFLFSQQGHSTSAASVTSDMEKETPGQFLKTTGTTHFNLIDQFVINGRITNEATHTNYRNLILRVTFYDKLGQYVGSQDEDLDLVIQYGYGKDFKLKLDAPSGTRVAGFEVVRAEAF